MKTDVVRPTWVSTDPNVFPSEAVDQANREAAEMRLDFRTLAAARLAGAKVIDTSAITTQLPVLKI